MPVDSQTFRNALRHFATGVTVVTSRSKEGTDVGLTVSAFSSLSLDPPLVLFCIGKNGGNTDAVLTSDYFAVNVLSDEQEEVSSAFAGRGEDKLSKVETVPGLGGCPVIVGCLTTIECLKKAVHDGGDHWIVVGEVEKASGREEGQPLLYFRGGYRKIV